MYPILVDIKQFSILVVGGGKIATRKVSALIEAGAKPTVISPSFSDTLLNEKKNGTVLLRERSFQYGDTSNFQVIFICTDNEAVNHAILNETTPRQLVNDTTNQDNSNFFNMAFMKERDFGIAITTNGNNPKKAKILLKSLSKYLKRIKMD